MTLVVMNLGRVGYLIIWLGCSVSYVKPQNQGYNGTCTCKSTQPRFAITNVTLSRREVLKSGQSISYMTLYEMTNVTVIGYPFMVIHLLETPLYKVSQSDKRHF